MSESRLTLIEARRRYDLWMKGYAWGATMVHPGQDLVTDPDVAAGWRVGRDHRRLAHYAAKEIYGEVYATVRLATST